MYIVNPGTDGSDAGRYRIEDIKLLSGSNGVVTEAAEDDSDITATELASLLAAYDPRGRVEVYVPDWEGQRFAYFDIDHIRNERPGEADIVLGRWIEGA
jgi:hypothetical protein